MEQFLIQQFPEGAKSRTTFPYISNIVNSSSPSGDVYGDRTVKSLFTEMQFL